MTIDIHQAKPLTRWLVGTITLHFAEGAVVERKLYLEEARRMQAMLAETRAGDALDWHALAWFQFEGQQVVFSSFLAAEDGGWAMDPDEREAVAKAGHPHGVLRSLVDYWSGKNVSEPEYSLLALHVLHRAAVEGMDRPEWESLARRTLGSTGARWLATGSHKPHVEADDSAEPAGPQAEDLDSTDREPEGAAGADSDTDDALGTSNGPDDGGGAAGGEDSE